MNKSRRSTGTTRTFGEIYTAYNPRRREGRKAADIAAVSRGETVWVVCSYRGNYGNYPNRFMGCYLDLAPGGPVIRPMLFFGQFWRRIPVMEKIISVQVRPFSGWREAARVAGGGQYAAGGSLEQSGRVPISCTTSGGVLEFAVPRPDVDLVLYYFGSLIEEPDTANPAVQTADDGTGEDKP